MEIKILTVGNLDKEFLRSGCKIFIDRIKHYAKLEIIEIKEVLNKNPEIAILEQTNLVLQKIINYYDYYKVLLGIDGKQLSSEKIAAMILEIKDFKTAKILFIIGGSHGFDDKIKKAVDIILSFGLITIPHQLCRLILLEQIYRSFKIINNETYHK